MAVDDYHYAIPCSSDFIVQKQEWIRNEVDTVR